jgi:DNA-binding CsgD family transcriptional regulator
VIRQRRAIACICDWPRVSTISEPKPAMAPMSPPGSAASGERCHACGEILPRGDVDAPALVLRATIPQPIAGAIRSAHALSAREQTVFQFLGAGYDNRSLARELGVSERTVKRHVTVILTKLRLESRLQAGLAALIISLSSPDGAK